MNRMISFFKDKGFYLAIAACVLAAVGSSVWAIHNVMNSMQEAENPPIEQEGPTPWQLPQMQVEQKVNDVPKPSAVPSQPQSSQSGSQEQPQPDTALQESAALAEPSFVRPVEGAITNGFSGDDLVYNKTLGDWRTHNGADLAAKVGDTVRSATAGKVCNLYEDGMWGQVIEVEAGEQVWRYAGLDAASVEVKVGDEVKAGTPLAKLGEAMAEVGDGPHLHLEVLEGGAPKDPEHYFE